MTTTNIHISITEKVTTTTEARTPTRRHVQIPEHDQISNDWFDAQKDQSASVRLLIHDDVRKHGIGDRVTREKFGTAAAAAAAPAATATPTATAASTAASSMLTMPDERDEEIARLTEQLERLRPVAAFLDELQREGTPLLPTT